MEIQSVFNDAESINVYNDGAKVAYSANDEAYNNILECWNGMIKGSHQMPAFGVSINAYTVKEMQRGLWVEFCYEKQIERSGMPFEKLLVNVNRGFSGFNVIRYTASRGYDGRCFYLDLVGKNMDALYDLLQNL